MAEVTFKEGDVVVLKSGGPDMTIEGFAWNNSRDEFYTDRVNCTWFDGSVLKKEIFKTAMLDHE